MTLLLDAEWARWSDREIARRCGVDESTVRSLDDSSSDIDRTYTNKQGTTSTTNTANIGRPVAPVEVQAPPPSRDKQPKKTACSIVEQAGMFIADGRTRGSRSHGGKALRYQKLRRNG